MVVILSMEGLLDGHQPGDRCRLCDDELVPPFLVWCGHSAVFFCGPCCSQIKRGLLSDLVHVAAIVELQELGYPTWTPTPDATAHATAQFGTSLESPGQESAAEVKRLLRGAR